MKTNGFYVIMLTSELCKLQDEKTIQRTFIDSGELVVKAQYLCYIQVDTNWYSMSSKFQHAQYFIQDLKLIQ